MARLLCKIKLIVGNQDKKTSKMLEKELNFWSRMDRSEQAPKAVL